MTDYVLNNFSERFINREISWLEFNSRVLEQATNEDFPLLERLKFLGIFTSNLDEFVMKRLGGLTWQKLASDVPLSADGLSPQEQLKAIRFTLRPLLRRQYAILKQHILPALKAQQIELLRFKELSLEEVKWAETYFDKYFFPILTPLAIDEAHPFPFINNLSLALGVALNCGEASPHFALVRFSNKLPYWIPILSEKNVSDKHLTGRRFISAVEIIEHFVAKFFPGMNIISTMLFRVTRNAGLVLSPEDEAEDLLEHVEAELRQRRFARVVRLEYGIKHDPWIIKAIRKALKVKTYNVYAMKGPLDYASFASLASLPLPELQFKPYKAQIPQRLINSEDIFSVIREGNLLVHHPYQNFSETVGRFVREAAVDPAVSSIKMTVYRVGDETPLIPWLIQAAKNGKQVVCLVELLARFDEERNIQFAQALEDAGVNIVYGLPGLKIHAKTLLVAREEEDGVRCYAHIGTGNYNSKTANLYTDLGFFTADDNYTQDALCLFNFLTGHARAESFAKLVLAPFAMENTFLNLIDAEIANAKAGRYARIILKLNALEDIHAIEKLYEASQAGVKIDLIVRGICCLRPQVKGLSENIRVRSIIGRYLEHSRILYFANGSEEPLDGKIFISSADWMNRNFHRRIELAVPMEGKKEKSICWQILSIMLADNVQAWEAQSSGKYHLVSSQDTSYEKVATHQALMDLYSNN